jgi:ABC-type sugar transport system substrate-binding protein
VLTTSPSTDMVFTIAFVQVRADKAWHDRVAAEVQAAAKRYRQLGLRSHVGDGTNERFASLVADCLRADVRAVLLSTDDWSALQAVANVPRDAKTALIAIDPLVGAAHATVSVGCDQVVLGRAAGEAVKVLSGTGGTCIVLGDMASMIAQRRHQGFVDALGLQAK